MLVYCSASVADGGPTLNQRWFNVSCRQYLTKHPDFDLILTGKVSYV